MPTSTAKVSFLDSLDNTFSAIHAAQKAIDSFESLCRADERVRNNPLLVVKLDELKALVCDGRSFALAQSSWDKFIKENGVLPPSRPPCNVCGQQVLSVKNHPCSNA
jgi:hypothetical protein